MTSALLGMIGTESCPFFTSLFCLFLSSSHFIRYATHIGISWWPTYTDGSAVPSIYQSRVDLSTFNLCMSICVSIRVYSYLFLPQCIEDAHQNHCDWLPPLPLPYPYLLPLYYIFNAVLSVLLRCSFSSSSVLWWLNRIFFIFFSFLSFFMIYLIMSLFSPLLSFPLLCSALLSYLVCDSFVFF